MIKKNGWFGVKLILGLCIVYLLWVILYCNWPEIFTTNEVSSLLSRVCPYPRNAKSGQGIKERGELGILKSKTELNYKKWFRLSAIKYRPDKPLQYFSQWTYWPTDDWIIHIKWGLKYLEPPLQDGYKVFEAGCGVGAYLQVLKQLYPHVELSGIDIVPEAIQITKKVLPGNFYVGDVRKLLKEKNNTYDYAASNCVIGYLNDLDEAYQMVKELARITKKGKPIMIASIAENYNSLGSLKLLIPKAWWYKNATAWNVKITSISRMGDWPGAKTQGDRYAVFMSKL